MENFVQDVRYALRGMVRSPGFTAAAVLTLALGMGATTAIFSVIRAVLLSPLPYFEPQRRVMVWSRWKDFDKTWVSEAELLDYRRLCPSLEKVAAGGSSKANLTGGSEPIRVGLAPGNGQRVRCLRGDQEARQDDLPRLHRLDPARRGSCHRCLRPSLRADDLGASVSARRTDRICHEPSPEISRKHFQINQFEKRWRVVSHLRHLFAVACPRRSLSKRNDIRRYEWLLRIPTRKPRGPSPPIPNPGSREGLAIAWV